VIEALATNAAKETFTQGGRAQRRDFAVEFDPVASSFALPAT